MIMCYPLVSLVSIDASELVLSVVAVHERNFSSFNRFDDLIRMLSIHLCTMYINIFDVHVQVFQ